MPTLDPYTPPATATDEYCLTMPRVYWLEGMNELTTFSLTVRTLPRNYGYLIAAGLEDVLRYLERFRFTDAELEALATHTVDPFDSASPRLYEDGFLSFLADLRFTGEVYAMPEGTPFYANEPIARIVAPRIEATIIEPALLSIFNRQTAVATKAARMVSVAGGRPLWEAGLRRAPGPETGPANARAAYIGGMVGTSNVHARLVHGVPSTGTSAHAYVMSWGEGHEQVAFEVWLKHNPHRASVLVDTYDIPRAIDRAIAASRAVGVPLKGIRIDSGVLAVETRSARAQLDDARATLDAAGMQDTTLLADLRPTRTSIMPTGDMDEYTISDLLANGGVMDSSYSGTALVNPGPIGGVYKLGHQEVDDLAERWVMKKAAGKATDPGRLQVHRCADHDVISLADEVVVGGRPLLKRVMALGKVVGEQPPLPQIRDYAMAQVAALPDDIRAVREPTTRPVHRTRRLWELRDRLGDPVAVEHLRPQPADAEPYDDHTAAWLAHYAPAAA